MNGSRLINATCLSALLWAAACSDPEPEEIPCPGKDDAGSYYPASDAELQKIIDLYQVTVIKKAAPKGGSVTCAEIPGVYDIKKDVTVVSNQIVPGGPKNANVVVTRDVKLPANEQLLVVVLAVATRGKTNYIVGRGCAEVRYKQCAKTPLIVDVIATTGRACHADADCEQGLRCNKGPSFKGGYCARTGCSNQPLNYCPPASVCVPDEGNVWHGICARKCSKIQDCPLTGTQSQHACVCRIGASGYSQACLDQFYNLKATCPDAGL